MAGLTGASTVGVGQDIVDYLTEVATFFDVTLTVTSGLRTAEGQANAMWKNWIALERGGVYGLASLPLADRQKLNDYYKTALEDQKATAIQKHAAKDEFHKLAKQRLGSRSKHTRGRAVDIARATVSGKVYKAIVMRMREVKEGKRTDIYHFESDHFIDPVNEALKEQWKAIKNDHATPHHKHPPHIHFEKPGEVFLC